MSALSHFRRGLVPRPAQVEAIGKIEAAFAEGKKVVAFEGPTGCGKSDVAMAFAQAAKAAGQRTFMLTSQKILQDQYQADFAPPMMETLKGRNAYPCTHYKANGADCSSGAPCKKEGKGILPECALTGRAKQVTMLHASPSDTSCPYWKAVLIADQADVTCFNFSSFLYQRRLSRFDARDLLVMDECHNAESQLLNFVELTLDERDLGEVMVSFDRKLETAKEIGEWVRSQDLIRKIEKRIEEVEEEIGASVTEEVTLGMSIQREVERALSKEQAKLVTEKEILDRLQFKIELFLSMLPKTEWVTELEARKTRKGDIYRVLIARPVYAKEFARELLFASGRRALCCSATILDAVVWARNLGLDPNDVEFVRVGSDFPKANRPIKLEYAGSMSWAEKDRTIPKLVAWVKDVLLPRHKDERGIIHAHSFALAKAIVAGVGSERLLLHESGEDKREVLARHAERADSVIVAPAFHEGIDLRDDLSRFQVIAKVPYPSTQDKVIALRMKDDPDWYGWLTALKIVQSYGRSVRSATDWAVTYIVDEAFESFRRRNGYLLPGWFKEAIVR
ncbi:MAG: helicase C-terminal domain-containing protein [Vicinamibacteria bacterium]